MLLYVYLNSLPLLGVAVESVKPKGSSIPGGHKPKMHTLVSSCILHVALSVDKIGQGLVCSITESRILLHKCTLHTQQRRNGQLE